jgi:hypothetical protein
MYRIINLIMIPMLLCASKYAGEFQELGVGGRGCAMGGTGVAQFVDPAVIYFNPAGSFYTRRGILLMHSENFGGAVRNEFGALVLRRGSMSCAFGIQYLSVSDIKLTTLVDTTSPVGSENQPIPYDTVGTQDAVFYINAARGSEHVSYGLNVKIFYRDLSVMTGYGGGVDLGCAYITDYLRCGFAVRDFVLSPLIWSNGTRENIIPKIAFGVAPIIPLDKIYSTFVIECDFVKTLDIEGFDMNIGCELDYKNIVCGRAGIRGGNYTIGAGLKYKRFTLDYALVTHSQLNNSSKISAGYSF